MPAFAREIFWKWRDWVLLLGYVGGGVAGALGSKHDDASALPGDDPRVRAPSCAGVVRSGREHGDVFMVRTAAGYPRSETGVVADVWVVTGAPQPEGFPVGRQRFCEHEELRIDCSDERFQRARVEVVVRLRESIAAHARYWRDQGFDYELPATCVVRDGSGFDAIVSLAGVMVV